MCFEVLKTTLIIKLGLQSNYIIDRYNNFRYIITTFVACNDVGGTNPPHDYDLVKFYKTINTFLVSPSYIERGKLPSW